MTLVQHKHDYKYDCTCGGIPEYVGSEWMWKCPECGSTNYGKEPYMITFTSEQITRLQHAGIRGAALGAALGVFFRDAISAGIEFEAIMKRLNKIASASIVESTGYKKA